MQQEQITVTDGTNHSNITMISLEQGIALNAALKSHDFSPAQNPETLDKDHRAFIAGYQLADAGELKGRAKICYNAGRQLRSAEMDEAQFARRQARKAKQKRNAENRMKRAEENRTLNMKKAKGGK